MSAAASNFTAVAASTRQPINLAMQRLWLTGQVLPAGARLFVQHVFQSAEPNPLEVIYAFPLPRDAALRRFRITGDGFEAHSELKETEQAVKAYEDGIAKGSLSTLARQYGDGLINLTVGNIRPHETVTVTLEILCGVELRDDGLRFRFPFTLAPTYHALAKAAQTAPGVGEIELPSAEFGDVILPSFHADSSNLHQVGFELSMLSQLAWNEIGSPSHTVRVKRSGPHSASIALAAEKDIPNRDLVLDVNFESVAPQILAGKTHFAAIVPSTRFGARADTPRRVVFLLDRSGSMQGLPMEQARKAIAACLGLLSETDSFGLVTFNQEPAWLQPVLVPGTREWRDKARDFLMATAPSGGTELVKGFTQASALLTQSGSSSGGDILILTDGQVSGTEKILADARATNVRLHCLGIGSASQDRFLALLARETAGVSRFVTPGERADLPAVDLFASIGRPVASGLKASNNIQPEPPSFVFSGTPVLLFGEISSDENQINLHWDNGGEMNLPVTLSEGVADIGETVRLLQGSRLITDWESRYPNTVATAPIERRKENRVANRLLELSRTYGLASREMSLVAAVTRKTDRAGQLPETHVVPVGMAANTAFEAYFAAMIPRGGPAAAHIARFFAAASLPGHSKMSKDVPLQAFTRSRLDHSTPSAPSQESSVQSPDDLLLELAARMESDGGITGKTPDARAIATVVALLAFLSRGHTLKQGAFRSHVARLLSFLQSLQGQLAADHQRIVDAVITLTQKGTAPADVDWITLARTPGDHWSKVSESVPGISTLAAGL